MVLFSRPAAAAVGLPHLILSLRRGSRRSRRRRRGAKHQMQRCDALPSRFRRPQRGHARAPSPARSIAATVHSPEIARGKAVCMHCMVTYRVSPRGADVRRRRDGGRGGPRIRGLNGVPGRNGPQVPASPSTVEKGDGPCPGGAGCGMQEERVAGRAENTFARPAKRRKIRHQAGWNRKSLITRSLI